MAAKFKTLRFHQPDPVVRGNTTHDAFEVVDEADESRFTRTKASDNIDWLPQSLKDRVDQHQPKDGDIDMSGNVKKCRLTEEAQKLFNNIQDEIAFVNFYQPKQMPTLQV
jgi:hypothetical protein